MSPNSGTIVTGTCHLNLTPLDPLSAERQSPLHPNIVSHGQPIISEKQNLYLQVRNHKGQNNLLLQDQLSSKFPTAPLTTSTSISITPYTTWHMVATRSPPRAPMSGSLSLLKMRKSTPNRLKPNQRISQIQKLVILPVHMYINVLILLKLVKNQHLAFWFPYLTVFAMIWMVKKSEALKIGEHVASCNDQMILHKPYDFQDQPSHRSHSYSLIAWAALAMWYTLHPLVPTAWHCILNVQRKSHHKSECSKKISSQISFKRLFQTLLLFSMMSSISLKMINICRKTT